MKCYRKFWDWDKSFVYYIHDDPQLDRFAHKFILRSKMVPTWHRGILPWSEIEDLEEISPLEILVMTGVGVEEAIETSR